jgi:hypothetical protein
LLGPIDPQQPWQPQFVEHAVQVRAHLTSECSGPPDTIDDLLVRRVLSDAVASHLVGKPHLGKSRSDPDQHDSRVLVDQLKRDVVDRQIGIALQ